MRRRSLVGLLSGVCLAAVLSSCSTGEPNATTTEVTFSPSTPPTSSFAPTSTTGRVVDSNFTEVVLVVGDWGSGTVPQGAVAGAMERYARGRPIGAVLTTGDNFYSDDAEFLMQPYQWVTRSGIDWWVTWGNYDVESQTRINVVNDAFGDPPRWTVFEWGKVDIVILDSNQVTSLTQAAFFVDAMAASDRPMVIALHHPPFSCSHQGATTEIVNQWVGILDSDVVMVLSGHDHSYQRFEDNGITYIVSGGGGRELRPLTDCPANHPERLAGAELHHFVALEQTNDAILITAIDVNGDTFDEWSIPLP